MANTIFHFEFSYSLNVQIEGLRAFAQSRLTARLGIIITANTKGKTWPLGLRRKTRHSRLRGNDGFFRGALNLFGLSRTLQYITELRRIAPLRGNNGHHKEPRCLRAEPGLKRVLHAINMTPKVIVPAQIQQKEYFSSHVL